MTYRNDFQATPEAVTLRQPGDRMPASTTSSPTVPITARSTGPLIPYHVNRALADRSFLPAPPPSDTLLAPPHRYAYIGILKSP
jgi:hypothetical protein